MSGVPPPVPPLNGLTLDSLGVRETKYVNDEQSHHFGGIEEI